MLFARLDTSFFLSTKSILVYLSPVLDAVAGASASAEDVVKCSSLDGDSWEETNLAKDRGGEDWVSHGGSRGWGGVNLGSEEECQGQAQESGHCLRRGD